MSGEPLTSAAERREEDPPDAAQPAVDLPLAGRQLVDRRHEAHDVVVGQGHAGLTSAAHAAEVTHLHTHTQTATYPEWRRRNTLIFHQRDLIVLQLQAKLLHLCGASSTGGSNTSKNHSSGFPVSHSVIHHHSASFRLKVKVLCAQRQTLELGEC